MNSKTQVIFRKFKSNNSIIAIFPETQSGSLMGSYMHIGQHGDCNYQHILDTTVLATKKEYEKLFMELEKFFDYNLEVIKKNGRTKQK